MTEQTGLKPFEAQRVYRDPLDEVHIGDWYWVQFDDEEWQGVGDEAEKVKVGEHETLMCVDEIGSNFVGFTIHSGDHSTKGARIHFDDFLKRCRPEPNWRIILEERMEKARLAIREKTQQLVREGQKVCLLAADNPAAPQATDQPQSFLPALVTVDPKKYKKDLVSLRDRMPEIQKEIEGLGEDFAVAAKNLALPDLVRLDAIKNALEVVEDRIFTIELYCGILEEVHQIAKGKPAPLATSIAIRQQMLYMDEETLFDYKDGGMNFKNVGQFDEWVVKPENLNRILPEPRGIVAFRVRRNKKDYGEVTSFAQAWAHMAWEEADKQTYLLIRNGENVYRIASEVDFSPRLIPKVGEIGKDQFTKIDERWVWKEDPPEKKFGLGGTHEKVVTETLITPDSIEYDEHMKRFERLLQHYNRIVILIQGLLDRSTVFHPHPPINLKSQADMAKWIDLIRDEERGLPSNRVTWEEYQKQLNLTLRKGKWVYVDMHYNEKASDRESVEKYERPRRGYSVNDMPKLCKVDSIKRDGSAVRVSWPWGHLSKPKRGRFVANPKRPGWGHYELEYETDRMCHEWVPVRAVLNVSDYHLGDYKMFLCDRYLQGEYLKWAQYILTAEDWARAREKGLPPEEDRGAQVRG